MTKIDSPNFQIDRPISGAKYQEEAAVEQYTAQQFLDLVDSVLAVKGVKALRFHAYTPYFADGDPCVYSVNEASLRLSKRFGVADEDGDYGDGFVDEYSLYKYKGKYTEENRHTYYSDANKEFALNEQDTTDIYQALREFNKHTGNIETVVKSNFGDHAVVTATEDGFEVEFYEHD